MKGREGYCQPCNRMVAVEKRAVAWSEPGKVGVKGEMVTVPHQRGDASCPGERKPPSPLPPNPLFTVTEDVYRGPSPLPSVEGPSSGHPHVPGISHNMHGYADTEVDPLGLPYGCMDAHVANED